MALQGLAAHQLHIGFVAHLHVGQFGFFEEAIHPERIHIHHSHLRFADTRIVATVHVEVGDITVHRRQHSRAFQVEFGGLQLRQGVLVIGQGRVGDVAGVVAVFLGDHQGVEVGAAVRVDLAHFPGGLA